MTETTARKGHCICGAIRFEAPQAGSAVGACHCETCRRWSGGPFVEIMAGTEVDFSGADNISVYQSSDWAERAFCRHCGTHLYYRLKENGQYIMPVGLFDDDAGLTFETEVFVDEQPHYYAFANKTERLTGAELFAKFSGGSEDG